MTSFAGIQRFHRRLIADHPYTRRHQIVSNIVKGGKCPFQCDFPTNRNVKRLLNKTDADAKARIKESQVKDVILLQGTIYSKTILLQYTKSRGAQIGMSGFYHNPTGNRQRFSMVDVELAPFSLKGKDLLEYAMRSTGEDANSAIFRHEVKIILANDLGITLEEDQDYDLLWYVSKLEKASTRVEDKAAAFNQRLQEVANRKGETNTFHCDFLWDLASFYLYTILLLFLPAFISKLLFRESKKGLEEAIEDAMAAKDELRSNHKELMNQQEQLVDLRRNHVQQESQITNLKTTISRLERQNQELRADRDKYRNVMVRVENVSKFHQASMKSFHNFASEAALLQSQLDQLRQEGNTTSTTIGR